MVERGPCQNTEIKRQSERHLLPGDGRGKVLSEYEIKPNRTRDTYFLETSEGGFLSDDVNKATEYEALTSWRRQRMDPFRIRKKNRLSKEHSLPEDNRRCCLSEHRKLQSEEHAPPREGTDGETCQDAERKRPSEGHSLSGDGRVRNLA